MTCVSRYWKAVAFLCVVGGLALGASCPPSQLTVTASATPNIVTGSTPIDLIAAISGGTEPYNIEWTASPSVPITDATSANASATVTETTTFTVTVTDSGSPPQTVTDTATVTTRLLGDVGRGQTLFNSECVGCHSAASVAGGADLLTTADLGSINAAMNGITLTEQQVSDLQAFLATQ